MFVTMVSIAKKIYSPYGTNKIDSTINFFKYDVFIINEKTKKTPKNPTFLWVILAYHLLGVWKVSKVSSFVGK